MGTLATCKWRGGNRIRYDHAGRQVDLGELVTEEFGIPSKRIRQSALQQEAFSGKGDSGSFVVDAEGRVCGLLYGGATGKWDEPLLPGRAGPVGFGFGELHKAQDCSERREWYSNRQPNRSQSSRRTCLEVIRRQVLCGSSIFRNNMRV